MSDVLARELADAAEMQRQANLLGRGADRFASRVWQQTRDAQEDAWSRDLSAEGARSAGLVSVPTSDPRRSAALAADGRAALVEHLDAFKVDRDQRRLACLRRSIGFSARAHAVSEKGHRSDVPWMVTLTYAGTNADWDPRHISAALHGARQWAKRSGFALRYVWVAELQKRGVIHYHLCVWLPRGVRMPKWDARGWWVHGMSNRVVARNAVPYLLKYMSKGTDVSAGTFPRGARLYGVGGLEKSLQRARRWLNLPRFVQCNSDTSDRWVRAEGGGWTAPDGSHWASEFKRVLVCGMECLQRIGTHLRAIEADGPFSWLKPRQVVAV